LAEKEINAPLRVKTAGALRSSVKDIEQYLNPKKSTGPTNRISERNVKETYGATVIDKLKIMGELVKEMPMPKELDNDEYIQAFDKNGIERRLKKLRLRRKILNRNKRISKFDEE
jgi:hypothetical protein